MSIRVPAQIRDAMIAHARWCLPEEACGLLAGEPDGPIRMAYALTNRDRSPVAFTIEPKEHFGAWKHAERSGWDLVGAFHSHPESEAYPSPVDVDRAGDPDWLHVVVGLGDPAGEVVRGFRIRGGVVTEEALEWIEHL